MRVETDRAPPPGDGEGTPDTSTDGGTPAYHSKRAGDRRVVERIRERVDCRRLADDLGVEFAHRSGEWWAAQCPTPGHVDSDPSAGIGPDGWRCHGCGESGDAFELWQMRRGCDFPEAKGALAERAGVDLPDRRASRKKMADPADESTAYPASEALDGETADRRARALLGEIWELCEPVSEGCAADAYLHSRGLSVQCARREGIQWAEPDDWRALRSYYDPEDLRAAGLMKPDGDAMMPFWWWEGAFVIFPYQDADGEVASLRFRRCFDHGGPKALGLRRAAGDLHRPPLPFGAPVQVDLQASVGAHAERCPLYVVEGELDALAMWQSGRRAIAAPSASRWPPEWCAGWEALRAVVVLADGDDGGRGLVRRVARSAARWLDREWVERHLLARTLGNGRDPCDVLEAGELPECLDDLEVDLRPFPEAQAPDGSGEEWTDAALKARAAVLELRDGLEPDEARAAVTRRGPPARLSTDDYEYIEDRVAEIDRAAPWSEHVRSRSES